MFSTNEYACCLAGLTVLIMFVCLSYVDCERVYECPFTGSMCYERETFYSYPYFGSRRVDYELCEEFSIFYSDFYPDRNLDRSWYLIDEAVSTGNMFYYLNQKRIGAPSFNNSRICELPYFTQLYNRDANFRVFLQRRFQDAVFTRKWFLEVACACNKCGGSSLNPLSEQGQALFAYNPQHRYVLQGD